MTKKTLGKIVTMAIIASSVFFTQCDILSEPSSSTTTTPKTRGNEAGGINNSPTKSGSNTTKSTKGSSTTGKNTAPKAAVTSVKIDDSFSGADTGPKFSITNASVKGDFMYITVSYQGGCKPHTFKLISNRGYMKSETPKLRLYLDHNKNGDTCTNTTTQNLVYNIKDVRYPGSNKLLLSVNDYSKVVTYAY